MQQTPPEISKNFADFYGALQNGQIKLSVAKLKKHWLWALDEGEGKPEPARTWLINVMLDMPDVKHYSELPGPYYGVVAALQASMDGMDVPGPGCENELDRVWQWYKDLIQNLPE